ncbi:uncharacterized protein LOC121052656 [Rosa chinensis]|uniref:uncharacterized protein LOC121052656 n=1 Tax=Rosa chinensis TaxID=74649 RepID=UPI001AD8FD36|nr:uncharacterized protein LOC121052656 [Rosa chinensis]
MSTTFIFTISTVSASVPLEDTNNLSYPLILLTMEDESQIQIPNAVQPSQGLEVSRLSLDVGIERMYSAPPSHAAGCPVIKEALMHVKTFWHFIKIVVRCV